MKIVVTGSIAYDYLMSFPGSFTEHLLPEHLSKVSLSFLVDTMDKRRGGCAPNIAYTLALLGERPHLMATAGQDFGDYRTWLDAAGVDTSLVKQVDGKFTASFFCSTDQHNNQIASFYTGAMANAAELSFRTAGAVKLAIVSPNDPAAMSQYAEECRVLGIPYIYDFGQQVARVSGEELRDGLTGAAVVISNDYEFQVLCEKTGLDEAGVLALAKTLIVTLGEHGCKVVQPNGSIAVPAVPAGAHRQSDRRRRRVPRRPDEGPGGRGRLGDVRAPGQRGRRLRARAPGRHQPRLHARRVPGPLRAALRRARASVAGGRVTIAGVRRTTAACLAASLVWLAAILAAPHALHAAPGAPPRLGAGVVYLAGRVVCHQRPERSFVTAGHPLPVCARCTGIYAAVPLACVLALAMPGGRGRRLWAWAGTPRGIAFAALPTVVSVAVEWITGWTDPGLRAGTGAVLGFAGAGLVCASLQARPRASTASAPPPLPTA